MVSRVLGSQNPPAIDTYDCIVVDECHRGYLIDRDMSEVEMELRDFWDYVSRYRRVLEYFDAVKIGLTATPALHTTQIFGNPVFVYSYREAVIDGYLVDHDPPIQIQTNLSHGGIKYKQGEKAKRYDPAKHQLELFEMPDEVTLQVEDFNRNVITEEFNRVVCEYLARELDTTSPEKTLIFCVNDAHADLVVKLLKEAIQKQYGDLEDDTVLKITGNTDQPLSLIRRFKNERNPNIAVTVDLLTTGIDVPEICNLVFLRRVNSRILYDQMLGRATRLCPEIGKEAFRVYDAVRIYEALQDVTAMQPVVVNPNVSFRQLESEFAMADDDRAIELVKDQFVAKLQRRRGKLNEAELGDFEMVAGMAPKAFIDHIKAMPLGDVATWFAEHPGVGEILDRRTGGSRAPILVSEHQDDLYKVITGYGKAEKPEAYLDEFRKFVAENQDTIAALNVVLTRPRDLTRKQLRELQLELGKAGFTERVVRMAIRDSSNQEIAASIIGYIRHLATGEPLVPYDQRVDNALQKILASRAWTQPQRSWLTRIAAQTKANTVVDLEMIDNPDVIFRVEGGGYRRLNTLFDGTLDDVLDAFHDAVWAKAA